MCTNAQTQEDDTAQVNWGLQLSRSTVPDVHREQRVEDASAQRRVLIVDDHKVVADSVAALLRLMGHAVLAVYDGVTAIEQATEFRPAVVVLDLQMPGMDGLAVARQLRKMRDLAPLKIVALSAFVQPAFVEAARYAGFDAYLTKPAKAEELRDALRH